MFDTDCLSPLPIVEPHASRLATVEPLFGRWIENSRPQSDPGYNLILDCGDPVGVRTNRLLGRILVDIALLAFVNPDLWIRHEVRLQLSNDIVEEQGAL